MRTYNVLMPWKASSVMEEKLRFIFEYERKESTMGELCSRFGISRETGYVLLRRFRQYGLKGVEELDRSRAGSRPATEHALIR
jgi:putative transposase